MKPYLLVLSLLLLVTGAFAASAQPAQLVALACLGITQFQNCPSGGRPDNVIQASDGNFYGVSEVTQEGESNPQGGSVQATLARRPLIFRRPTKLRPKASSHI